MTAAVAADRPRRSRGPVTMAERQLILDRYLTRRNGKWLSTAQVARLVGRSANTVYRVVRDAGVLRDRSEAAMLEVPAMTRRRVLQLRQETGWGWEKVSAALDVKPTVVRKVFDEANVFVPMGPNSRAKVTDAESDVIVGLYQQGQPIAEVATRTGYDKTTVTAVLRAAEVPLRSFSEANSLAQLRLADRRLLARVDIVPLATRWLAGAEVEELAAPLDVAPDLLWDKLAEVLADLGRCAGCAFACTARCARDSTPITAAAADAPVTPARRRARSRLTPADRSGQVRADRCTGSVLRVASRGHVEFSESGWGFTIH